MNDEYDAASTFNPPVSPASPERPPGTHDIMDDDFNSQMSARAMYACVRQPGDGLTLKDAVNRFEREIVNCSYTGYDDMLQAQAFILNGVMAAMIERGMNTPDLYNTAISAALRAQKQFQDISRTRLIKTMDKVAREKWDDKKQGDFYKQNEQKWD